MVIMGNEGRGRGYLFEEGDYGLVIGLLEMVMSRSFL